MKKFNGKSLPGQATKRPSPIAKASAVQTTMPKQNKLIILENNVLKSATKKQLEVITSMEDFMQNEVNDQFLKSLDKAWQPQDLLPDPTSEQFIEQVQDLRVRTAQLPRDYLVALTGDMITEEALPTYMTILNTIVGIRDETGFSDHPWAKWTRQWTAEENRHGDAMNKYMYLSGRVDMRAVEVTIHKLITRSMNIKIENNPYFGFIYTTFQERATRVSHGNTARIAKKHGDEYLAKLCGFIAADESRHMSAYAKIVEEFFKRDPSGAMLAFEKMMRDQITMPAMFMDDDQHASNNSQRELFSDYALVAERSGVYTARDYADIMRWCVARWNISSLTGLSNPAIEAQQYVCQLPDRIEKLADRRSARRLQQSKDLTAKFSWVFNEDVKLI